MSRVPDNDIKYRLWTYRLWTHYVGSAGRQGQCHGPRVEPEFSILKVSPGTTLNSIALFLSLQEPQTHSPAQPTYKVSTYWSQPSLNNHNKRFFKDTHARKKVYQPHHDASDVDIHSDNKETIDLDTVLDLMTSLGRYPCTRMAVCINRTTCTRHSGNCGGLLATSPLRCTIY